MPFNKALKERISREKNIAVRERHEQTLRRNYNILLILFLGGGYLVFRNFFNIVEGLFISAIFLAWYGFLENVLHRYADYTDELIRAQDGSKKSAPAKRSKKK
ncbi:hypothetical protein K9M74_02905 [Candidatus Woesearchaeota archaeon]|nr:hypothetical protein [Candidatus Woesearchaeota archaeon]